MKRLTLLLVAILGISLLKAETLILESHFPINNSNLNGSAFIKVEDNLLSYSIWINGGDPLLQSEPNALNLLNNISIFQLYGSGGFSETFSLFGGQLAYTPSHRSSYINPFVNHPADPPGVNFPDVVTEFFRWEGSDIIVDFSPSDLPPHLHIALSGITGSSSGTFNSVNVPEPSVFLLSSLFSFHLLARRRRISA